MSTPSISRRAALIRLGIFVALIAAAGLALRGTAAGMLGDPLGLAARLRSAPGASALFVLVYAVAATLALPATPFTLAGGIVFGFAKGSALNWMAATIGATGSFILARALGADAIRLLLGRHAARLDTLSSRTGAMAIGRLRLIPLIPFDGLSVASGLARVPTRAFVVGTALGIIPGTLVYTWFAQSLALGISGTSRTAWLQVVAASFLLLALSFLPSLVRRTRRQS
ncbi:MAG TPA: VTT domain-containing protein [Gemmatimonadaceae bacterium]|nr:VTT domain-containing protein [Gemmatimonadaceae bacterium]